MKEMKRDKSRRGHTLIMALEVMLAFLMLTSIAGAAQFAYVTNSGDNTVSVIDIAKNEVAATVPIGSHPEGIVATPDGKKVYVTNTEIEYVSVIDTATNKVIATIPVGQSPYGIIVSDDGTKVYVTNTADDTISVINTATDKVVQTFNAVSDPVNIEIGLDLLVTHNNVVDRIDPTNIEYNPVTSTYLNYTPYAIASDRHSNKVYVTHPDNDIISVIEINENRMLPAINNIDHPTGIELNKDYTRLYVVGKDPGGMTRIYAIDTATDSVVEPMDIPYDADAIAVTPDGSKICIASDETGGIFYTIDVSDEGSWPTSEPINVGSMPRNIAVVNVPIVPDEPIITVGQGASTPEITQKFIDACNRNGGLSVLGNPTTEVHSAFGFEVQDFPEMPATAGGVIMYNPNNNTAYFIHGAIWDRYYNYPDKAKLGPVAEDEKDSAVSPQGTTGRYTNFKTGTIHWISDNSSDNSGHAKRGESFVTYGDLNIAYRNQSGTYGSLGFPIKDQEERDGHGYCEFEGGNISWDASTGTYKASTSPALTTESLVRVEGSSDVYLIENGNKHRFTSEEALLWNGHSFDDVNIVTSETLQTYSDGEDISISQAIIDKYNALGGASFFGASKGDGEKDGKPDQDGNYCSYVNFEKGAIECFAKGPNVGKAYAIVGQFYTKWTSMGYGASVLGYPIGDMSEEKTSIKNTSYKYQLFTNGTQLGALEWNLNTNQVYEVHGAIFAKWAEIGFASSVLGLPTGDEQDIPNSKYGTVGRYGTFENGHIHWNKATGVSFVTSGDLNECYNKIQGTQSDLGFPIMSQVGTTDGHDYCEFEKGYIEWNVNSGKYEPNYSPNINQRIDAKLKAKPNFPQYLLDPDYVGRTSVLSVQLSDFILKTDLTGQYDKLYNDGIRYYGIRNCYLHNAKQSLKNNDITGAEKFLERADKMQMCSYNSFQAANDVFVGSTESAEILAQGVRTECELICNIGLGYAPYSSLSILGQSVKCKDAMFVTFACVDICKEWKINGFKEGAKQGVIIVLTDYITSGIEYDVLGGKTLQHSVVEGSIDISKPAVRKQINVEIVDKLMTPEVQKALFDNGFHGTAIGAADAAAMYFTEDQLSKVIDLFIENTCRMIDVPIETVQSYSPVELRVYDSTGRVTGLVDGVVKNEIPNSIYQPELEKVFVYNATDTYRYETVGTANSTYGLKIVHYDNMTNQEIMLTDVPITINTKNIYNVDWENEAQVNKSVITDTKPGYDIEKPVIESAVLFPANTTAGSKIDFTASITDNIGVSKVAAGDIQLMSINGNWQGNITAPSSPGKYSLSIKANDAAGNTINTSVPYNVVRRQGKVNVAILPTASKVVAGKSTTLAVKVKNTQNVDDTFKVRINLNGLPAFYRAGTSWFSWTEKTVNLRAKQVVLIPVEVTVPAGTVNGIKFFKLSVNSEKYSVQGSGTGSLVISRTSKDTNKQTGPKEPRFSR